MSRSARSLLATPREHEETGPRDATRRASEAELQVAESVGHLMEFWGFKRSMGRIWTVLYFSPEPLDTASLAERLQMSNSAVSMAVSELQKWRAVRKTWVRGERRDYFEVEHRIWKLVRGVVERRELVLIRDAREAFAGADDALREAGAQATDREARRMFAFKRRRLTALRALARVGDGLVRAFVAGNAIDPRDLIALQDAPSDPEDAT